MPQALTMMRSPSREGKKRRGYDLSPRISTTTRAPVLAQERLPPIRSLLSDIPDQRHEPSSQLRAPMSANATGPRRAIPARLSPPSPSRRSHIQPSPSATNGAARSPRHLDDRSSSRSSYDSQSAYSLPMHSGPPSSRTSYSPSTLGPVPVSPYATSSADTRWTHSNGCSHSLPAPPTPYYNVPDGRPASYAPPSDYRNGDLSHGSHYHKEGRSRGTTYQSPHHTYPPMQYAYPPHPPPANGSYSVHHQYQNGYLHGSMSFESDDSGSQAPRRRRGNLPRDTTDMLKQWFADHLGHPYPTEDEKQMLCRQTGLQMTQISNWFINARRRRIPELMNQATAETRLRENSGESSGSSD